jgi:MoxR-like ATPase
VLKYTKEVKIMKTKLKRLIKELDKGLIEREEHIKLALLSLLANENMVLIGPPGTAKSEISRRISKALKNGTHFEYLLTKFTTPEEIFGPISIKELENDNFHRQTKGYISESNIVFLDEVFKANSSILNSLLTILNERIYHNGSSVEKTKIFSIISASNELPFGHIELEALYDRFLIKKEVAYVKNPEELIGISLDDLSLTDEIKIKKEDIDKILKESKTIQIPDYIKNKIINIKKEIEHNYGEEEKISDRRLVKAINFLKVAAFTNDKKNISIFDLLLLQHIFWKNPKNIDGIKKIIIKEIMSISSFEKSNANIIYERWKEHFNSFFVEQIKDSNGIPLYIKKNGEFTTEKTGEINLKDSIDEYIFYKGYRDHVKVLTELGKFDDGYNDTGIRTKDDKIVWKYEFSSAEVKTSNNENLKGYKKLTINGNLPKAEVKSFREFKNFYKKSKIEFKSIFKEIERNVVEERKLIHEIYVKIKNRRDFLDREKNYGLWLDKKEIEKIENEVMQKVEENKKIMDDYDILLDEIKEAMM